MNNKREYPEVRVGQVYKPRDKRRNIFVVVEIYAGYAFSHTYSLHPKERGVRLDRLQTRYELIPGGQV